MEKDKDKASSTQFNAITTTKVIMLVYRRVR